MLKITLVVVSAESAGFPVLGPVLVEALNFKSTNTQRSYKIKQKLNCDSSYVIYLATCQKCKGQYVGKSTTPFKKRHSNHKQEIKKQYGGLVAT